MNKVEYLSQLDDCLKSLTEQERREALEFYYSYFEDGMENGKTEQQIIEELGSPREAAEKIFSETGYHAGEKTEDKGYGSYGSGSRNAGTADYTSSGNYRAGYGPERTGTYNSSGSNAWKIVLIVIGCIFLLPPAAGIAIGLLGAIFGILVAIAVVLVVVPVALFIAAFATLASLSTIGVSAVGWCFLLFGLSMLAVTLSCLIGWQIVRLIQYIYRQIRGEINTRKERKNAQRGAGI